MMLRMLLTFGVMLGILTASAGADAVKMTSTRPGASEADAINQAIDEAAVTLLPVVRERMTMLLKQEKFVPALPADDALQHIISAGLREGKAITGRSVELQSRPYGNVYYATLTIDTSAKWLDDMARRGTALAKKERQRDVSSFAGMAALLAVVTSLYFAANAFTKGYYRSRLRLMAAVAAVAGMAAVAAAFYGTGRMTQTFISSERTIEQAWQN